MSINGFSQKEVSVDNKDKSAAEVPSGVVSGLVKTIDNQPAARVTVHLKELNRTAITDDAGQFTMRNVPAGIYTIEISMIGLQPQQKLVDVKKDQQVNLTVLLQEDVKQLNDVVVATARRLNGKAAEIGKIDINPMDLPQAISVIGQATIREQQALRLSDVVRNVNGVYLTTTRASVQESFAARGYSFGSTNLFKNGSRVNSGAMPEMSSLEKVEVLKGSAAILFGQVAPGGILNMVTKEPRFNFGGEVSMRAGSFDLYKPAFDLYGPLNKSIAYRLNGTFESAGSFRDGVNSKRYYINPSFLIKAGKKTDVILEADYLNHEFTPDFGIGSLDNTKIPDVPRGRFMGTSWQYNTTQQATAGATVRHTFNDSWKLNSTLSYQYFTRDYYGVERIQAAANGDWTRPLGRVLMYENYYTGQVNLLGKFNTGKMSHDLLAGIDADRYLTLNNDFSFPAVAGLPAGGYDKINILDPSKFTQRTDIPVATNIRKREAPINRFGAYVQDLVKITSKLNLLAGIRWSYVETAGIDSLNVLTGVRTTGKSKQDEAFSPRLGIVYKPFRTTSFFGSYSNSFVVNTGQDVDGNVIKPSIIDQYEIGVKNEFFKGLFSANVTVYRIQNSNLAQTAPFLKDGTPNNSSSIKALMGKTLSDGVEIDLAGQPIKGLNVAAGYSYNYARYTEAPNSTGSNKAGERMVNNPSHTANASFFYTFNCKQLNGLKLGATAVYIGDRFGGWNNTVNQSQTYSRLIPVAGFTTIDVTAGYTYKKISVLGKVSNITNTYSYYVHENYSVNPIAPTQVSATVSYKF
ncbi:MAG: TonB-dependent receptor [Chitinophagaceae bacterium]|nr:TonB-dependent receptor [Chitinophagaceae bacterium]